MKVLDKKRIMAENLVKYAKTEKEVLSFSKHPFIVGLESAFQTDTKLFMILEYCPRNLFIYNFIEETWEII